MGQGVRGGPDPPVVILITLDVLQYGEPVDKLPHEPTKMSLTLSQFQQTFAVHVPPEAHDVARGRRSWWGTVVCPEYGFQITSN